MSSENDVGNLNKKQLQEQQSVEMGHVDEVPVGRMKYVEVQGKEIVISNIESLLYIGS